MSLFPGLEKKLWKTSSGRSSRVKVGMTRGGNQKSVVNRNDERETETETIEERVARDQREMRQDVDGMMNEVQLCEVKVESVRDMG